MIRTRVYVGHILKVQSLHLNALQKLPSLDRLSPQTPRLRISPHKYLLTAQHHRVILTGNYLLNSFPFETVLPHNDGTLNWTVKST